MTALPRPAPAEYNEYYRRYVDLVPDGDIVETLERQIEDTLAPLAFVSEEQETRRYAPGKWSLREAVGHAVDTERMFAFRALAMAREDAVALPGMDQDDWAARSNANDRPLAELTREWVAVRRATVLLFASFDEAIGLRTGMASGNRFTVRAFPWIIAGHELWHRRGFERDYLAGA